MAKDSVAAIDLRPVHPFPARMAASIALRQLRRSKKTLRVLDPFAGSGTSVVVAKSRGHNVIGFDLDPMAVLLSTVWSTESSESKVRSAARRALRKAKIGVAFLKFRNAYPCLASDEETKKLVRYWFDPTNRQQLTALSRAIRREKDPRVRTVLWCAFSRMIITKQAGASLAMDLAHSRPHRVRDRSPFRPLERFMPAVDSVLAALPFKNGVAKGTARVRRSDARGLPLPPESIDLVITSPPYLNAIDYFRCHKFSLVWMGYSISDLRARRAKDIGLGRSSRLTPDQEVSSIVSKMVGCRDLSDHQAAVLGSYITDMREVIKEIYRVLVPNGKATIVIGNSTLQGTYVRNSLGISLLAKRYGLRLISRRTRILPDNRRYLPPPSAARNRIRKRMRTETVMTFQKRRLTTVVPKAA